MARSPSEIPPANLLGGKYRLIRRIGKGGMGNVWVARNEATHAEVAIKTLLRGERNEAHDERFRREARLAATVSHRNVIRVFDLVEDPVDGTLALVMELLKGRSLERVLQDRRVLSPKETVAIAVPLLSALAHVHAKGIVHRDIKPGNVFFALEPDGHVIPKLLDFGIAKLPAQSTALTRDGNVLGTPQYMSPEQIRGSSDELDGRSDQFSAASLVLEMLTGTPCFLRDSAAASLAAVLEADVDPDPSIPPDLWFALARALKKLPYERYDSCNDLADALRAAVSLTDDEAIACLQGLTGVESSPSLLPTSRGATSGPSASPSSDDDSAPGPLVVQLPLDGKRWRTIAGAFVGAAVLGVVVALVVRAAFAPPAEAERPPAHAAVTAPPPTRTIPPPTEAPSSSASPAASGDGLTFEVVPATPSASAGTSEPVAGTPTTKPAGTKPAGTKPAGTKPAGTKPAGTKPAGTKPVATSPGF